MMFDLLHGSYENEIKKTRIAGSNDVWKAQGSRHKAQGKRLESYKAGKLVGWDAKRRTAQAQTNHGSTED
jgi:hypothetical protein